MFVLRVCRSQKEKTTTEKGVEEGHEKETGKEQVGGRGSLG